MQSIKLLFCVMVISLFSACSSSPAYRAASGNGFGYAEQHITDNYYRVTFKARGDDQAAAKAYALRRAAELTAQQGYDWFVVVETDTLTERQRAEASSLGANYQRTTERQCGLLGCRERTVNQPSYSAGIQLGADGNHVEVALEVRMGKGVTPDNVKTYPANTE